MLSAGAVDSPRLLMLSGIGPAEHLREHGIDVIVDAARVGDGLQDHPLAAVVWRTPATAVARVTLRSADPRSRPAIDPAYLADEADLDPLVAGVGRSGRPPAANRSPPTSPASTPRLSRYTTRRRCGHGSAATC